MKPIIIVLLFCISLVTAAKAQSTPAEQLASGIAQRMMDSLQLTSGQRDQLYNINMQLHNQKRVYWQQYSAPADTVTLRYYLQRVENTRDSLYHTIISDDKFILYKQRKINIVRPN